MEVIKVKIADLAVAKGEAILITIGLGSCVGIALYEEKNRVGGLAHILLSDSSIFTRSNKLKNINPAKYADTAIPLMVSKMQRIGAQKNNLVAKIAGGSRLFQFNDAIAIGEKNIEAVRRCLTELSIPIIAEDVGGNYGRTMKFYVHNGSVTVSSLAEGEKEL